MAVECHDTMGSQKVAIAGVAVAVGIGKTDIVDSDEVAEVEAAAVVVAVVVDNTDAENSKTSEYKVWSMLKTEISVRRY
jgi:hypothetical protein